MSLMWSVVPGLLPKDVATPASINDNTQLTLGDILLAAEKEGKVVSVGRERGESGECGERKRGKW